MIGTIVMPTNGLDPGNGFEVARLRGIVYIGCKECDKWYKVARVFIVGTNQTEVP